MKEIWLKIAEHEIGKDSSRTADILSAANGVITVADVLKYFPEFATIDHFKQALCSSLVAVSRQIDEHQVTTKSSLSWPIFDAMVDSLYMQMLEN